MRRVPAKDESNKRREAASNRCRFAKLNGARRIGLQCGGSDYRGCEGVEVFEAEFTGAAADCVFAGADVAEPAPGVAVVGGACCGAVGGFRPAVLEPRPRRCRLDASSLPLASRLLAD